MRCKLKQQVVDWLEMANNVCMYVFIFFHYKLRFNFFFQVKESTLLLNNCKSCRLCPACFLSNGYVLINPLLYMLLELHWVADVSYLEWEIIPLLYGIIHLDKSCGCVMVRSIGMVVAWM